MQGIKLIILFGSRAAGTSGARSDTDIAVLADSALSPVAYAEISRKIGEQLGVNEDSIDIVELRDAPPLLQREVAENGRLLWGDPHDFVRFRVLAWKRYVDTAKFRRARERFLDKLLLGKAV